MLRLFLLAFSISLTAVCFSQTAVFFSPEPTHKFPVCVEGDTLHHTFEIENKGTDTLRIYEFRVACPCTKVTHPFVVAPGAKAQIQVTFETKDKHEQQDRKIYFRTNTKKQSEFLRFKVFVNPKEEK